CSPEEDVAVAEPVAGADLLEAGAQGGGLERPSIEEAAEHFGGEEVDEDSGEEHDEVFLGVAETGAHGEHEGVAKEHDGEDGEDGGEELLPESEGESPLEGGGGVDGEAALDGEWGDRFATG